MILPSQWIRLASAGGYFDDKDVVVCHERFVPFESSDTLEAFSLNGHKYLLMYVNKESFRSSHDNNEWCSWIKINRKKLGSIVPDSELLKNMRKYNIGTSGIPFYTLPFKGFEHYERRNLPSVKWNYMDKAGNVRTGVWMTWTEEGIYKELSSPYNDETGSCRLREPDDISGYYEPEIYKPFYVCDLGVKK